MSKAKDKRIKKLRKKRIWPSIVGLFLLTIVFALGVSVVLAVACIEIVQRKVMDCSVRSAQIAAFYEGCNEADLEDVNSAIMMYLQFDTEMETVGVLEADGTVLWSSDDYLPKEENTLDVSFMYEGEFIDAEVIVEDDSQQLLVVEDGVLTIGNNFFEATDFSNMLNERTFFSLDEEYALHEFKVWYVIPVNNLEVYVLNSIHVYGHDFLLMIVCLGLMLIVIAIFVVYYLISFVSVIVSVRKTTRIIYTDMVTGGNNWLHFVKRGTTLLKRNRMGQKKYAMVHFKMRKYRSFCTCFGVQEGEELIEKLYLAMKKKIKYQETMAHHENAEFGLLITYTDREQLIARMEEIETHLNGVLPGMKLYFGVGIYFVEKGEKDVERLYNNALIACEKMGEEAENKIAFYNIEMNQQKIWERKVEDDMERALINKEFQVYLQPKISTTQEALAGAEALVRWVHPTEGFIPPYRFIPIFEQNGFILKLDDYMLEEVARQQAEWIAQGRKIVPISVNVSRAHFTQENLAEHICSIVDKYQVPHNIIELELTESAFFDDKKILLNTVKKLKEAGFIVSMDDFGAGYSSLNSLKELQLDVLKIDADFFRGADVQERGLLIVSEVIDLAKKLNMKIVAEGIESREQVDFLTAQECDLIQGYFYAKPMPIAEFVEKYKEESVVQ